MQPSPPARNVRLFKYISRASLGVGLEVHFDTSKDTGRLLDDLHWLVDLADAETPTDFVVLAPRNHSGAELRTLGREAKARGFSGSLSVVVPWSRRPSDDVLTELQTLGLRVLLGGVGANARFSDLTDSLIDGVIVDGTLVSAAYGDPQAASVLEAMAMLARNVGLRTFASQCSRQEELEHAMACGIDFASLESFPQSWASSMVA